MFASNSLHGSRAFPAWVTSMPLKLRSIMQTCAKTCANLRQPYAHRVFVRPCRDVCKLLETNITKLSVELVSN